METRTFKNWWFLTTNGLISIVFGLLMLLFPQQVIVGIILYFGIALLLSGVVLLAVSINNMKQDKKAGMILFQSIASVAIGLAIILSPKDEVLRYFLLLVGVWAIIVGVFQIAILVNVKKTLANKNIILFNGLFTMALGVFLCSYPVLSDKPFELAAIVAQITGLLSVLFGLIMIYLSFLLRKVSVIRGKENEPHVL